MTKGKRSLPPGVKCLKVNWSISPSDLKKLDDAAQRKGIYRSEVLRQLIRQGEGAGLAVLRKD